MMRIVKLSFHDEYIASFQKLFENRKERIRQFPGCTYLSLLQDTNDQGVFYTYSLWQEETDLESYRVSALFQETWAIVKQWFKAAPEAFSANPLIEVL